MKTYPDELWERIALQTAGFSVEALNKTAAWLDANPNQNGCRLVVVHKGRVVYELYKGIEPTARLPVASAAKSLYANILGIAVMEGRLPGPDEKVVDYYPEMMDVPPGYGPKEGRHAFEKDRQITFRQLISNVSGYMKPGEAPGQVFHYQTYGMNILTHALGKIYGVYDTSHPANSPGFGQLIQEKLARPIGAVFEYAHTNFDLHQKARLNIFGNYCQVYAAPLDLARLGWLWCCGGRWADRQVIPENWLRESVEVAPDIKANCPEDQWEYGQGFWTNASGRLASGFPQDMFTASGAGGHFVTVYPSLELVIVQNPGPYIKGTRGNFELQKLVLEAMQAP